MYQTWPKEQNLVIKIAMKPFERKMKVELLSAVYIILVLFYPVNF